MSTVDSRETERVSKTVIGIRKLKEPMPAPANTRVFVVANQKGGVGKTTSTVNIAAALAMGGLRVLVIDLDPQGNASTALGVEHKESLGVFEILMGSAQIQDVVQKVVGFAHLECIPSNTGLAQAEINLVPMVAREMRLKDAIEDLIKFKSEAGAGYDYIFIDCPPSLGLLTINAFAAAKELLIPIQCEYYALEGLTQLLETYSLVKKRLNPNLNLSTIILTMFDSRTKLANDVADSVRQHFPNELINIPIPRTVRISEAPSYNQTIMTYDPVSPGAVAYMQGNVSKAKTNLEKALNVKDNSKTKNNLAGVAMSQGDRATAKKMLSQVKDKSAEVSYNNAVIMILEGKYSTAATSCGSEASFNKALAQLLNGNLDDASKTLSSSKDKDSADGYYLKAIIAARSNAGVDAVVSNLKSAISKDKKYKEKAAKDREFIKFMSDASFSAAVN